MTTDNGHHGAETSRFVEVDQEDPTVETPIDVDDTQGWGPENVNLDDPEQGRDYSVGVKYFTDRGFGVSFATVRVFLAGRLVEEIESPALESGQFWKVADIDGNLEGIDVVDEVYEGFPD